MKHGGARTGAGRKSKGIRKPVTINLPEADWEYVEYLLQQKKMTKADYFRDLVDRTLAEDLQKLNYGEEYERYDL